MANIVAIVGRPNVGKSTFFNRMVERRQAIMDNESGVTRDRHYGYAEWVGKHFTVIDTGGYVTGSEDVFEGAIREQVEEAMNEASVILFMADCHDGLTDLDKDFAKVVRGLKKPVMVVANKADTAEWSYNSAEFYGLGLGDVFPISSASGSGTGELLDEVVKHFEDEGSENPDDGIPRIAILGRPNAGKSSFVNALLGRERTIVTDVAGTTRDTINSRYKLFGQDFILTDTAGIRKKSKVHEDIEFYSVMRALQALQDSDVCVIMIDATRGLEAQDMNIISLALKYKKGIMLMMNKWDLIEKETNTMHKIKEEIDERLGTLSWIPKIFTSVTDKKRIFQAIELAVKVYENRIRKVATSDLNEAILPEIERYPPPALKGKYIKIKYITQLPTLTPTIAFFCNLPQYIKEPYERYLENKIRENFDFEGVPVKLVFRKK
ncbi:GTP-binding protein [Roseivirga pacifica]|uniref:GTPase Der n=1 Tax=Roseivirga pacifica TaxID=1267423 RepID=A0A1I0MKV5_9BACT|nr:ribosome biogenesis GTPase Der [Roseivirga pacifica]MCO6359022.1 ribosome biogenesis GTPase Der [Roseivirga pacifica]MCO6365342.1 ribosome biogenesis GTPase Der [Roseivirga pacifica]MCO6371928.1 ribosome biogenesis GTPase Der [Roseivirga pacifica]MCO6375961.1 ribosome biogenesis GTPase Der [Roseivirga pacifica]MCO6379306.1 ribosome biogenesis GTPase Der [Roseivirga pacifica]